MIKPAGIKGANRHLMQSGNSNTPREPVAFPAPALKQMNAEACLERE